MDGRKENYFILLGLSPSISDINVINARIDEMEKKWKDRVTKLDDFECKRFLSLLADIRETMRDPKRRRAEAEAAVFASANDPSALEALRKSLPDNYANIEKYLTHLAYADIYDFLNSDPVSGNRTGRFSTTNTEKDLIIHANDLIDKYRIKPNSTEQMQLASLIAGLFQSECKNTYDAYIVLLIKSEICKRVDACIQVLGEITDEQFAKIVSEFSRVYFSQKEVDAFARGYCNYKGYKTYRYPSPPERPRPHDEDDDEDVFGKPFGKRPITAVPPKPWYRFRNIAIAVIAFIVLWNIIGSLGSNDGGNPTVPTVADSGSTIADVGNRDDAGSVVAYSDRREDLVGVWDGTYTGSGVHDFQLIITRDGSDFQAAMYFVDARNATVRPRYIGDVIFNESANRFEITYSFDGTASPPGGWGRNGVLHGTISGDTFSGTQANDSRQTFALTRGSLDTSAPVSTPAPTPPPQLTGTNRIPLHFTNTHTVAMNAPIEILGNMSARDQSDEHTFTPTLDGSYRFVISGMTSGSVNLAIVNSDGFTLSNERRSNGEGTSISLEAGETYTIWVTWRANSTVATPYTLQIWYQKPTIDISEHTEVTDSMQFRDQRNLYTFTPTIDGNFRFAISGMTSGSVNLAIVNSDGFTLSNERRGNGEGTSISLEAGETYTIWVMWRANSTVVTPYTLQIWHQKPTIDVSGYADVTDSMQFRDQWNLYDFIPAISGSYRFAMSGMTSGSVNLAIVNSAGFTLTNDRRGNGEGTNVTLEAGETYTIWIMWRANSTVATPYTLSISLQ